MGGHRRGDGATRSRASNSWPTTWRRCTPRAAWPMRWSGLCWHSGRKMQGIRKAHGQGRVLFPAVAGDQDALFVRHVQQLQLQNRVQPAQKCRIGRAAHVLIRQSTAPVRRDCRAQKTMPMAWRSALHHRGGTVRAAGQQRVQARVVGGQQGGIFQHGGQRRQGTLGTPPYSRGTGRCGVAAGSMCAVRVRWATRQCRYGQKGPSDGRLCRTLDQSS